ncbi:hypothetical protein J3B02_006345, partial [Coemansia erecta]
TVGLAKDVIVKFSLRGVSNLEQSLNLLSHMKKHGTVTSFRLARDPLTLQRTGMAVVSYLHADDCRSALNKPHQTVSGLPAPYDIIDVSLFIKKTR